MMDIGPQFEHDRYEELCALATAGTLTPAESELLSAHLETCSECREAFAQYQKIATDGMPFLARHFAASKEEHVFDESSALARLLQATEKTGPEPMPSVVVAIRKPVWTRPWVRGLVAASLIAAVAVGAYRTGAHSTDGRLRGVTRESRSALDRIVAEKVSLEQTIQTDSQKIATLEQAVTTNQTEVEKLRAEATTDADRIAALTGAMNTAKQSSDAQLAALAAERDAAADKLHEAEKMYQTAQEELNTLRNQHQQDLIHLASLSSHVESLTAVLNEQGKQTKADEQYLASDKDIRDLIGARNLYIADIMDVNESGQSRRPFGRVFYTKTKSLIFYAYDLDHQPGVKQTSAFQVWGRTTDRKPINLGILYMDSATNRRWTLRVDNPEQLARLDLVFVTIEPREQTDKPTGKPFLYASLRREPNHP